MTDELLSFKYFADPHMFSTYSAEPMECDICHQILPGYPDAYFGDENGPNIRFVCEPDLHLGKLADVGAAANIADEHELRVQITELRKDWDEVKIEQYVQQQTREIEACTPSIPTWQDYEWPVHCSDYMRYVKELGQADCAALSESDDGREFFRQFLEGTYTQGDESEVGPYVNDLWDRMRPDSPKDSLEVTPTSFYLFQCIQCGSYLIEWDTESVAD